MAYTFLVFNADGIPQRLMNEADVLALLGAKTNVSPDPNIKPTPSAEPYSNLTRIGSWGKAEICVSPGVPFLIAVSSRNPFTFQPKGYELDYDLDAGHVRPAGEPSGWYGNSIPKGFKKPAGFRIRYYQGKVDQPYYEQSNQPDETPNEDKVVTSTSTFSLSQYKDLGDYELRQETY